MNKITKEKKNSKNGDRAAAGTKINSEFSLNKSSMVRTDIGDSDPEVRSNDLKELTAQWMQLERKTLEQRKNAAKFYDDYLMKPIEEEFVRNNQDMVFEEVEIKFPDGHRVTLDLKDTQPKCSFVRGSTSTQLDMGESRCFYDKFNQARRTSKTA